jgi:two-component system aerobic respiration control sensor histidine kinase ArcB
MPAARAGASGQVVDRAVFDSLVETIGAESTEELLGKLLADTDSVAEGIGRGRRDLDLSEIRSQTHILVSVAGAIGAHSLQHVAQRLNAAANRREAETIDELCGECLAGLKALQGFILAEQGKAAA